MKFVSCFILYVVVMTNAHAAVISRDWQTPGDGLLTYDTVNQREWLDLTQTQLFKFPGEALEDRYQSVVAELAPGGLFEGFSLALPDDVLALAQSAGIDTTTTSPVQNQVPAQELVELLGDTLGGSSHGTFGSIDGRSGDFTGYAIFSRSGAAGIEFRLGTTQVGVWLYRQIPEPTSVTLIVFAILIGCTTRQKF